MIVIGVTGKKQVGKDTLCNFIKDLLPDMRVEKLSFAKALKDFVINEFGIFPKYCYGSDDEKNYPINTWQYYFSDNILAKYKKNENSLLSTRELLQIVGTDIFRETNVNGMQERHRKIVLNFIKNKLGEEYLRKDWQNIWIDILVADCKASEADIVCVPDIRFMNEIDALRGLSAFLVRLYRFTGKSDSIVHKSEQEMELINDSMFNYVLYEHENANLSMLRAFAIRILMQLEVLG